MNEKYVVLKNAYIEILIAERFDDFGEKVLDYSTKKVKEYLEFFQEDSYGKKIKGAFFTNRKDFLEHIEEIKDKEDNMPPSWATGCFYGGETQVLMDENKLDDSFYVLGHEIFHLMFSKFVYEKKYVERIIWLDEALAGNFDGTTQKLIDKGYFRKLVDKYYYMSCLPTMDIFNFEDNVFITDEYNGYDLFKIIGRYLLERYDKEELLEYVNDYRKVCRDGKDILRKSLEYFHEKYKIGVK